MRLSALLIFIFIIIQNSFAQWDCRSILGAHLHPIFSKKSPVSAGIELTGSQGWMNDRRINNLMAFAGLNIELYKNHNLYFEGGFKGWNYVVMNEDVPAGKPESFSKKRLGIREGLYRYSGLNSTLTIGFQSITASDLWLVNERGLGVKYSQSFGKTGFDFAGATVVRDFSRMGSYCTVKYIYNLIKDRPDAFVGNSPGETNFTSVVWWFDSNGKKNEKQSPSINNNDEFKPIETSGDEFKPIENSNDELKPVENSSDDEFKTMNSGGTKKSIADLAKHGLVLYSEFGSKINNERFWLGYMANGEFFGKINAKAQLLYQADKQNNMAIMSGGIEYLHSWPSSHITLIGINSFYAYEIDSGSHVSASFTNFFIGEVLRMESQDMPLSQFYVKHIFPGKQKVYIKAQHVMQFRNNNMAESDLESGLKIFKHFRITGILSRITANSLENPYYMFRLELRMAI